MDSAYDPALLLAQNADMDIEPWDLEFLASPPPSGAQAPGPPGGPVNNRNPININPNVGNPLLNLSDQQLSPTSPLEPATTGPAAMGAGLGFAPGGMGVGVPHPAMYLRGLGGPGPMPPQTRRAAAAAAAAASDPAAFAAMLGPGAGGPGSAAIWGAPDPRFQQQQQDMAMAAAAAGFFPPPPPPPQQQQPPTSGGNPRVAPGIPHALPPVANLPIAPPSSRSRPPSASIALAGGRRASSSPSMRAAAAPPPGAPNPRTTVPGLYSATGFDIMGVLAKVATRSNPQVSIGPVDMSCSFVVSDARKPDQPILYVSETFERLTGYSSADCVGRNCRFLQSPDGLVNEGSHRRYTDNATVAQLKHELMARRECQFTLINYRKGGEPFINLITIIPISWERDSEVAYFVGFQVDLVEQPNAIMQRMRDGTYVVNYQVAEAPVAVPRMVGGSSAANEEAAGRLMPFPPQRRTLAASTASAHGQGGGPMADMDVVMDDIGMDTGAAAASMSFPSQAGQQAYPLADSTALSATALASNSNTTTAANQPAGGGGAGSLAGAALTTGGVEGQSTTLTGHFAMDVTDLVGVRDPTEAANLFYRALVDQVDFIHVLSLRGVMLYVSQDCQRVLEYSEAELVGRSLSEFCHPGDLVSVMRELKESSNGVHPVNMVYRIRRKNSGYMWMEVSGKCTQGEKAKGKKFVVLTGREKPVVRVHRHDIIRAGGVNDVDMWAKLALEGLFLHVSTDAQALVGFTATELVGKSLLDLVHIEDLAQLRRALDLVRQANVVTLPHRIKNKKGEYLQVMSAFVPGNSATPGDVRFALHRCTDVVDARQISQGLQAFPANDVVEDTDDLFDVLSPVRCTSWQYELHQLRLQNRRLRAEIEEMDASVRGKKKRNNKDSAANASSLSATSLSAAAAAAANGAS